MQEYILELKAGTLVCFSSGCYSDYSLRGHFLVVKAMSKEELLALREEINKDETTNEYGYCDKQDIFLGRLVRDGHLLVIDVNEIHIGSYGDLDLSI